MLLFSAAEKSVDTKSSNLYYICIQKIGQFGWEPILGIFFELWLQTFSPHLIFCKLKMWWVSLFSAFSSKNSWFFGEKLKFPQNTEKFFSLERVFGLDCRYRITHKLNFAGNLVNYITWPHGIQNFKNQITLKIDLKKLARTYNNFVHRYIRRSLYVHRKAFLYWCIFLTSRTGTHTYPRHIYSLKR
jgi:hypothetical protein